MNITTGSAIWTATLDHRTGATLAGGPASRYQRVARCDGRRNSRTGVLPNYAARRLGALFVALSAVMAGAWLVGEVAAGVAGQPASAAAAAVTSTSATPVAGVEVSPARLHVARDGDTLWSIADEHRGEVSRNRYVDALVEVNGTASIRVSQAVRLP